MTPVVLVVGDDPRTRQAVVDELAAEVPAVEAPQVDVAAGPEAAAGLVDAGRIVPLVIVVDAPAAVLGAVHAAAGRKTRVLLVTGREHVDGLSVALSGGHLHGVVAATWTPGEFGRHLAAQVRRGLEHIAPEDLPVSLAHATDRRDRAQALAALGAPDDVAATALLRALDRVLGRRPRLRLDAGSVLVREGEEVNGIIVVVSGDVRLERRTAYGDQALHRATAGPVIGLLSFTQQRRAFVTAVTTSEVEAVHLTLEQLDQAMRHDGEVATLLSAVLLRSLATRLVRADELQLEVRVLNHELATERDRLAAAMARVEAAELQLVDAARMATLGELAAGIAHELNNPAGALQRAAAHLADDVASLLDAGDRAVFTAAVEAPPASAAAQRRARRQLEAELGDADLAAQVVRAGVTDLDAARRLAVAGDASVVRRTTLNQLAAAVRNTTSASRRIAGLVASLRAYVRGSGAEERADVDVREGLDDTIRLLGHRLEDVDVQRDYVTEVPPVRASAGELNQVWTNLLANAADALDGTGHVVVSVERPSPTVVRVRIADDGPGISADVLPHLFEPRFTTKGGRVEYGLGLGLSIAKQVVDAHGGTLVVASEPGRTTATVDLPARVDPIPSEVRSP